MKSKIFVLTVLAMFLCGVFFAADSKAQTRRTRTRTATATPTPSPQPQDAAIISLADQNQDDDNYVTTQNQNTQNVNNSQTTSQQPTVNNNQTEQVTQVETKKKLTDEEKQKRLLMNLEILSKAEQRAESLRKQLFDIIDKQNTLTARIDQINYDLRPEVIDRYAATIGSLRPEAVRESRKNSLESEKRNIESLLTQITSTRIMLEQNVQKADAMVEKLRSKLEKEINDALEEN